MKALIIGATGATGRDLIDVLLPDPYYDEVVIFIRRPVGLTHPKLVEVLTDFDNLEGVADRIKGDILFSCLGTTLKAAGSKENQRHIDYEIPLKFAGIAKRNGVRSMVLLSAYGASASSRVFYSRLKGELEDAISDVGFDRYLIFKPGSLVRKDTDRVAERLVNATLGFLNGFGILKRFRPLPTATLAEKLAKAPQKFADGKHIVQLDKIFAF